MRKKKKVLFKVKNIHKKFKVVRETEKAVLLKVDGIEFWLPKSVIHNVRHVADDIYEAFVYDKFWNENYNKMYNTFTERQREDLKREDRKPEPEINPNDLPKDLIKRIIKFIHPDRHENSREANELTAEILKLWK